MVWDPFGTLRRTLWIGGGQWAGKSTVARLLVAEDAVRSARAHDVRVIDVDGTLSADQLCYLVAEHFEAYLKPAATASGACPAREQLAELTTGRARPAHPRACN